MGGKRKIALDQLELFSRRPNAPAPAPSLELPPIPPPQPNATVIVRPPETRTRPKPPVILSPEEPVVSDEWWTTRMVCAFLKISRKTLWERRRNASLDFPRPVNLGGSRNVYRASAIRAWAETMAIAEWCELG